MRANTKIHDVWKPNYWEHIVRDEPELKRIREYIHNNPARWELDKLHPGWGDGRDGGRRGEKYFAPTQIREQSAIYGRDAQGPDDEEWEEWMSWNPAASPDPIRPPCLRGAANRHCGIVGDGG